VKVKTRRITLKFLTTLIVITFYGKNVTAAGLSGRFDAGLNYPGASIRYGISSKFALQGKFQFSGGVTAAGSRLYYYIKNHEYERIAYEFTGLRTVHLYFLTDDIYIF